MGGRLLVGIDIGTTSVKTVLFDADGAMLSQASQEYSTQYPRPGWAEQDPEDWWRCTCQTLKQALAAANADAQAVACLGVSCQAPTMLALDASGRPLHPALIWMDRRSEAQCDWLRRHVEESCIQGLNGGSVDPYYLAPKMLWLRDQHPELYQASQVFLQANGYVAWKLTGVFSMDVSHGPLTLFFDSQAEDYAPPLLEQMGLDQAKLPPVMPCAEVIGQVTAAAADECGLLPGTPVVAGAVDGTAAALEAGLLHAGQAVEMTGQSTVLLVCSDHPYQGRGLIPLAHGVPGKYLVVGAMVATGGSLRWFRDQLGGDERRAAEMLGIDPFELLSLEAGKSSAGAHGLVFLPYMYGERSPIWDSQARGVFCGLSLSSKKADMVRAIMEGAAYGLRHNVEAAAADGFPVDQLVCVGGGSRSAVWNQIKADVLGIPVRVPRAATGAPLGDVMLAAVASGLCADFEAAVQLFVHPGQVYYPEVNAVQRYNQYYPIYLKLYPSLKDIFAELGAIGG
jgi:xylulokinase